jgi:hypothetical protein
MACCTTINPLNSGAQKRGSGGLFDLPRTAKRRRPFATSSQLSASLLPALSNNNNTPASTSTMFVTSSSLSQSKSSTIIDASSDKKQSVFNTHVPFSTASAAASSSVFAVSPGSFFSTQLNSLNLNEDKNELMERIKHEAKRLIKRKQVNLSAVQTSSTSTTPNENNANNAKPSADVVAIAPAGKSVLHTSTNTSLNEKTSEAKLAEKPSTSKEGCSKAALNHNDLPIFSMNQVNVICERMMKEREKLIREQYDKILAQKLSEQYDAFVKFTHEQIQRRFESSQCSYVS